MLHPMNASWPAPQGYTDPQVGQTHVVGTALIHGSLGTTCDPSNDEARRPQISFLARLWAGTASETPHQKRPSIGVFPTRRLY